jgi:adenine phosphoribosyltransferase
VTTLIGHGAGFAASVELVAERARHIRRRAGHRRHRGAGLHLRRSRWQRISVCRFVPVRKPGKLPVATVLSPSTMRSSTGSTALEVDPDADWQLASASSLIDDLLATGGTALAAVHLIRLAGGVVDSALFVIDLPDLGGSAALERASVTGRALLSFEGH